MTGARPVGDELNRLFNSISPVEKTPDLALLAKRVGFSLDVASVCEAHQRGRLERLCRHITRPRIANKRLSVDSRGRWITGTSSRSRWIFAPNFKHRNRIVPRHSRGRVHGDTALAPMSWAQRLKREFRIDIEACPHCGGTLRVIARIENPSWIRQILGHIQRCEDLASRLPRAPPDSPLL
jgi:hypothetical protein